MCAMYCKKNFDQEYVGTSLAIEEEELVGEMEAHAAPTCALHAQPAGAVTVTVTALPLDGMVGDDGERP